MSSAMHDHEAALRRALLAAEQIEPAADGLDRVQARLYHPLPVPLAWASILWTRLCLRVPEGLWTAVDRIGRELQLATERFLPAAGRRALSRWPARLAWLRPLAAMGTVVAVVAVVVYAAIQVPQIAFPSNASTSVTAGGSHHRQGSGGGGGHSQTGSASGPISTNSGAPGAKPRACSSSHTRPTSTTTSGPSPTPTASGSPSPTPSPSPSPSSSASPTNSASPTPSSSGSSSPTPATTGGAPPAVAGSTVASAGSSTPATTRSAAAKIAGQAHQQARPTPSPCQSTRAPRRGTSPSPTGSLHATGLLQLSAVPATGPAIEVKGRI